MLPVLTILQVNFAINKMKKFVIISLYLISFYYIFISSSVCAHAGCYYYSLCIT